MMALTNATPSLTVAIAQSDFLVGDIDGNVERIVELTAAARDEQGADIVVFPELCVCGYPPEDLLLRPEFLERVEAAVARLQARIRGIAAVLGYPSRRGPGLRNTAGVFADGACLAEYYKHDLPNYSVFDEKRYFVPGTEACRFDLKGVPCCLSICEDIWSPAPVRQAAATGAHLMLNLNASPFHLRKDREREALLTQRCVDHDLTIVYANLVGGQDELVFDGGSLIVERTGVTRQRLPAFRPALRSVRVTAEGRIAPPPNPLPEPPTDEASLYAALILGVRDYVRKNRFPGALLGLSGGIDSALTLAIAADALGGEGVEAVLMPSRFTAAMSLEDARAEAQALGVQAREIPIEPPFQAFLEVLGSPQASHRWGTTEENIQARCRGVILMARSNRTGRLLLSTGNKSEMAVGYSTLYGDMAGGFAPLKDLPKTAVYRLAHYRNQCTPVIPTRVLERPPTAELAEGQQDQDSLPPYERLDPILERYVEQDFGLEALVQAGYDRSIVEQVIRLVDRNEYKRRQAPPGVRLSRRAFGRDRRYPITSGFRRRGHPPV